nr:hypothetical protein [candidate division Zixibacteria bacterium]
MEPGELAANPNFARQKRKTTAGLSDDMIDKPIIALIRTFNRIPCCFTLQCCYGHFVYGNRKDPHNLDPLPVTDTIKEVEYRIAYVCFCVKKNNPGRKLLETLKSITLLDPENIQFCGAEWFWERQVNSYVLQVEPDRFKHQDTAVLSYREALHIEKVRDKFFVRLRDCLDKYVEWQ